MTTITPRWAGPSDAASGSVYKVERSLDLASWTTLAAAQVATSPYVSLSTALDAQATWGDASIVTDSVTSWPSTGYVYLDDALVYYGGTNGTTTLQSCIWLSGSGTYSLGTLVTRAHESISDTGVTVTNSAVVYRITHTNPAGEVSVPTYLWHYELGLPINTQHILLAVHLMADVGGGTLSSKTVHVYLAYSDQFSTVPGQFLGADISLANTALTNDLGIALFHLVREEVRQAYELSGDLHYKVEVKNGEVVLFSAPFSPAAPSTQNWLLLSAILD